MFDHIQIKVQDLERSRPFYEAVLGTLGYKVVLEFKKAIGIGTSPHDMFEISQADTGLPLSSSVHVAFIAKNEEAVRKFYETALARGAKDNGAPGLRDYEEGYYSAFVIDPDGHNLEAVFKKRS